MDIFDTLERGFIHYKVRHAIIEIEAPTSTRIVVNVYIPKINNKMIIYMKARYKGDITIDFYKMSLKQRLLTYGIKYEDKR